MTYLLDAALVIWGLGCSFLAGFMLSARDERPRKVPDWARGKPLDFNRQSPGCPQDGGRIVHRPFDWERDG